MVKVVADDYRIQITSISFPDDYLDMDCIVNVSEHIDIGSLHLNSIKSSKSREWVRTIKTSLGAVST